MSNGSPRALSAVRKSPRADTLPDATLPAASLPDATLPDASLPDATLPVVTLGDAMLPEASATLHHPTIREVTPFGARVGVETSAGPIETVRETWGCPLCGAVYPAELTQCPVDGESLLVLSWIHTEADALVGLVIQGRYAIESVLGRGGMGTVYQARHIALGKRFALKVLRQEVAVDAASVQRFMQEAQITAAVKHENLADVSDCGEITKADIESLGDARLPFFVMEMLRGQSLGERLREKGNIDEALAAQILRQCALGLSVAHDAGVVHRDLKPDNIFLTEVEGKLVCKILDFGVAKITSRAKLTKAGTVFGTPHYMSPEQASGGALDGRTDIYALGIVMYEALSGNVPFSADTNMGVLTKHVFELPQPIENVVRDPSRLGVLGPIVMRCLEKDPEARFANALDLARTVEEAVSAGFSPPVARPEPSLRLREPSPPQGPVATAYEPAGSRRLWLGISAVALLLCLVGGAFVFTMGRRAGDQVARDSAESGARSVPSSSLPVAPASTGNAPAKGARDPATSGAAASTGLATSSAQAGAGSAPRPAGPKPPRPTAPSAPRPSDVVETW